MASDLSFVTYVAEQVAEAGRIAYKKMFGEYLVYVDEKPILLICDNMAYVKIMPATTAVLQEDNPKGYPYAGAKEHYILDIDETEKAVTVCVALKEVTPLPKKKKKG